MDKSYLYNLIVTGMHKGKKIYYKDCEIIGLRMVSREHVLLTIQPPLEGEDPIREIVPLGTEIYVKR